MITDEQNASLIALASATVNSHFATDRNRAKGDLIEFVESLIAAERETNAQIVESWPTGYRGTLLRAAAAIRNRNS